MDDSGVDAARVQKILTPLYHVETISDGAAALERLASGVAPDLLLLDWIMPGISGLEVCEYIRSSSGNLSKVPIILLTAHGRQQGGREEIVQAFKSGVNDYVSKPFVDEELKVRVDSLMNSKRLLERAEEAEEDVRTLLENAPDPTFAVDAQARITFANDEGLRILKRTSEEVLGQSFVTLFPMINPRYIGIGPGEALLEVHDIQWDGRTYSPSFRVLPSDSAASTTVSLRDVTQRKQTEMRRLDFYSIIAHDLRTPTTSVLLRIQMALRGKHGILPAGLIVDLRRMEASLRSQVAMINDFLDLARLEGVGYKIDREPVNLRSLIESTAEDFQPLMEKNNLTWKLVCDDSEAITLGDHRRLVQVVANLIGNAIKFTGGDGSITAYVRTTGDQVELLVEDTGRGIAPDEISGLFERFKRARGASFTSGTGLGLMIIREIIEAHAGTLGVESELGVGSTFWVRLPRHLPISFSETAQSSTESL